MYILRLDSANCSSADDSGNFAFSSSSRSNAATSPSTTRNANIPSTSTGITSNFRGKSNLKFFLNIFYYLNRNLYKLSPHSAINNNRDIIEPIAST